MKFFYGIGFKKVAIVRKIPDDPPTSIHYTMKLLHILSFFVAALFFAGCASTESSSASEEQVPEKQAPETAVSSDSNAGAKTAYDGNTGSGLLMERYKSGAIEGLREN